MVWIDKIEIEAFSASTERLPLVCPLKVVVGPVYMVRGRGLLSATNGAVNKKRSGCSGQTYLK